MAVASLLGSVTWNTTAGSKTVTATPAVGDQIFLVTAHSGFTTTTTAPTDNNPDGLGAYTIVASALKNTSADLVQIWRRNSLVGNASSTVFTHAPATTTGGGLGVIKVTGIPAAGTAIVIQSGTQANAASGTTPTVTLGHVASPSSVMIGAVFSTTNGVSVTERTGYTEQFDAGYNTPTSGLEIITRNSGEVGSSIVWGSTVPSAYGAVVVEINAPAVAAAAGSGSATGVGASNAAAVATAAGIGAASAVGASQAASAGAASGTGAASGAGRSNAASAGASAGTGAASGVGSSLARSAGASAGVGAASGVSSTAGSPSVGAATGTGSASASGQSSAAAVGASAGLGAANANGTGVVTGSGAASGSSTASATGKAYFTGVGLSAGFGVAVGAGQSIALADGFSAGTSSADAGGIAFTPGAKTYPLAGIAQDYPGTAAAYPITTAQPYPQSSAQTYPLEGEAQQYPLAS